MENSSKKDATTSSKRAKTLAFLEAHPLFHRVQPDSQEGVTDVTFYGKPRPEGEKAP